MDNVTSNAGQRRPGAVLVTLAMIPGLAMIGLATDAARGGLQRQAAQAAAQSAAIAGAMAAKNAPDFTCGSGVTCQAPTACPATLNTPLNPIQAACLYARQKGFTNGADGGKQTVTIAANAAAPPVSGTASGTAPSYWITATISQKRPLTFLAALGQAWGNVSANSTAAVFGMGGGVVIMPSAPSDSAPKLSAGPVAGAAE